MLKTLFLRNQETRPSHTATDDHCFNSTYTTFLEHVWKHLRGCDGPIKTLDGITKATTNMATILSRQEGTTLADMVDRGDTLGIINYPSGLLYWQCPDAYWVSLIGSSLIILIGVIGNGLSFAFTCRPSLKGNSFYKYLATLSVVDLLHLLLGCTSKILRLATNDAFRFANIGGCGTNAYMLTTAGSISGHLLAAVSIERFICVSYPLKCREWFSPRKTSILIAVIVMADTPYPTYYWPLKYVDIGGHRLGVCSHALPAVYTIAVALVYSYGPLATISIMNVLLLVRLARNREELRNMGVGRSIMDRRKADILKTIPVLMSASLAYMLTTGPTATMYVLRLFGHRWTYLDLQDEENCTVFLGWTILSLLRQMNYAINFYLYCLTSAHFRRGMRQLFCGRVLRQSALSAQYATTSSGTTGNQLPPRKTPITPGLRHSRY